MGASELEIEAIRRTMRPEEDFELFEDNVQSATIFRSVATQWRYRGMDGLKVGLDYNVLPFVMEMLEVQPSDRKQVFEDVIFMEDETLLVEGEKAKRA